MKYKPLVTVILIAYNQEKYIENALQSVLNQRYKNIEYILSDDASTDTTYARIEEAKFRYSNLNIVINRNLNNLGIGKHVNSLMQRAGGEIIVIAAGDDISSFERVSQIVDTWEANDRPMLIASNFDEIDEDGKGMNTGLMRWSGDSVSQLIRNELNDFIGVSQIPLSGATFAISRRLHELFGEFDSAIFSEDVVFYYRANLLNSIYYISTPLVRYRRSNTSVSNPLNSKKGFPKGYTPEFFLNLYMQMKKDAQNESSVSNRSNKSLQEHIKKLDRAINTQATLLSIDKESNYRRKLIKASVLLLRGKLPLKQYAKVLLKRRIIF